VERCVARSGEVGEESRQLKSYRVLPDSEKTYRIWRKSYRVPGKRAVGRKSNGSFPFNRHIVPKVICGKKVTFPQFPQSAIRQNPQKLPGSEHS